MEHCKIDSKSLTGSLIISLIIILLVFLVVLVISNIINIKEKMQTSENTITVSDTGTIYAKPDLALTAASVITDATTVAEALQDNTKKMNAIIAAVKGEGVEDKDLKTTSFNIYPRYEYRKEETEIYPYPPGKRVLVGYEISQSLEIKIRNMEKIGDIIEVATNAGANEVSDLQFTIDKEDELKAQARAEAINKAKTKAEELAKELGVKLIKVTNFSENGVVPIYYGTEKVASVGGGTETPQIQTGENKIEVTVYITYAIKSSCF